jgi:hypothetical protein
MNEPAPLVVHWPLVRGATPFSLLSFLPCNVPTWEEVDDTIEGLARQDSHPLPRKRRPLFIGPIQNKRHRPPAPAFYREVTYLPPRPPACGHTWVAESSTVAVCRWCSQKTTYTPTLDAEQLARGEHGAQP